MTPLGRPRLSGADVADEPPKAPVFPGLKSLARLTALSPILCGSYRSWKTLVDTLTRRYGWHGNVTRGKRQQAQGKGSSTLELASESAISNAAVKRAGARQAPRRSQFALDSRLALDRYSRPAVAKLPRAGERWRRWPRRKGWGRDRRVGPQSSNSYQPYQLSATSFQLMRQAPIRDCRHLLQRGTK